MGTHAFHQIITRTHEAYPPHPRSQAYGFEGKAVIFFATSGGSTIDKANKDFAAAYPKINWKAGKTLNYESKEEMKIWVEGLK